MLNERKAERNEKIKKLRDDGRTYKEIGEIFGISVSRAREIYIRVSKKDKCAAARIPDGMKLTRYMNTLKPCNEITEEEIYMALQKGIWIKYVGKKTLQKWSEYFKRKVIVKKEGFVTRNYICGSYTTYKRLIAFEEKED